MKNLTNFKLLHAALLTKAVVYLKLGHECLEYNVWITLSLVTFNFECYSGTLTNVHCICILDTLKFETHSARYQNISITTNEKKRRENLYSLKFYKDACKSIIQTFHGEEIPTISQILLKKNSYIPSRSFN